MSEQEYSFDHEGFKQLMDKKQGDVVKQQQTQLLQLSRAAVPASSLTNDPSWDSYLTYLQGVIEISQKQVDALQTQFNDGDVYDHASLLLLKSHLMRAKERIKAWTFALDLPKAILESADKANELLEKYKDQLTETEKVD